jgi:hypothetical protein
MPAEKPRHGFGSLVSGLQEVCESGVTKDLAWRRSQLKGLLRLLTEKEEEMFDVLRDDLGKHRAESYRDEVHNSLCPSGRFGGCGVFGACLIGVEAEDRVVVLVCKVCLVLWLSFFVDLVSCLVLSL